MAQIGSDISATTASGGTPTQPTHSISPTVLFAAVLTLLAATTAALTPPFQSPDAFAHFLRAASISYGSLIPAELHHRYGASLPASINTLVRIFQPTYSTHRITIQQLHAANSLHWTSPLVFIPNMSTAFDPPILYLPQALGLLFARITAQSLLVSYYASIAANAATGITLLSITYHITEHRMRPWLFILACLPMSVSLLASPSRDALLLPLIALASAVYRRLSTRPLEPNPLRHLRNWIPVALLIPVLMTKPPYLPLLALFPLPLASQAKPFRRLLRKYLPLLVGSLMVLLWLGATAHLLAASITALPATIDIRPRVQLVGIITNPIGFIQVLRQTLHHLWNFYAEGLVGILGWLDVYLPIWSYFLIWALLLGVGTFTATGLDRSIKTPISKTWPAFVLAALAASISVFATMYMVNSGVGWSIIIGVQGRYFLPILGAVFVLPTRRDLDETTPRRTNWIELSFCVGSSVLFGTLTAATLISNYWLT